MRQLDNIFKQRLFNKKRCNSRHRASHGADAAESFASDKALFHY